MSESNRVSLTYVPESTYGTTPTDSADWETMRYTGESLATNPSTAQSAEIRADRENSDLILQSFALGGDVNFEFSADTYDVFLESVMGSAFSTGVLKGGTSSTSYTITKQFQDLTNKYTHMVGMRVGALSLNFEFGSMATGTISFAGKQATKSTSSLVGAGSVAVATTTDVMSGADVSNLQLGTTAATPVGSLAATNVLVRSISLNINANLRPNEGLGSQYASNQAYGSRLISGSINYYYDDDADALHNALLANTPFALQWDISDGTTTYTFLLPRLKLAAGDPMSEAKDSDVMTSSDFTATYSTEGAINTALQITKA